MPRSHTTHYNWSDDDSLTSTVIQAVAAVNGHEPTDMQPLYEVVDPDALEVLFTPGPNDGPETTGCVSFVLDGAGVTIYTSGEIVVELEDREETAE